MSPTRSERAQAATSRIPAVPLTIEGSSVLHQMLRVRWREWRALDPDKKQTLVGALATWLSPLEKDGKSACYSLLGHKGDLMLAHFRDSFQGLHAVEMELARLGIWDYLESTSSYLSVVE